MTYVDRTLNCVDCGSEFIHSADDQRYYSEKGFASPEGDKAGVLLKHMNMKMSLKVSMPPVTTMSLRPVHNSNAAR